MVLSKPLSYDCTRHIIKHTDPNLRILLSLRCPSIQAFEKSISFKCQQLQFSPNWTSINGCCYINNLLLRGRSEPIRMKRLEINVTFLRLPGSVKYHSKEVDFRVTGFGFDLLKKILDVSSFPLNFYGIGYISEDWTTFEHPVFRSARNIFISNKENNQPELFRSLLKHPNKSITVQSRLPWITFQTITDNWKTTQRKVGTSLTIERVHTEDVENVLNQILQEEQHRENKNGDLIIPLYQDKSLKISSGDIHEKLPSDPKFWNDLMNFLKLEVIDVDSELYMSEIR
ncbi:Protein CBG22458 [Caenorhabditis briggsae]|uniref:Uncharacterized protein n=2 Tax=Caenorhabditis briggsae TaxID=6238 RepID=A0AAE9AC35_CAEBR|nr:Protein CBG22458 [Caenorhabditis briggsae]ULT93634.1 hypothetical protein L3Y34_003257 [Caenorhabditis briggsae]CAP39041.2 Protein CBG22458 [Caenorhabditis briggsae]